MRIFKKIAFVSAVMYLILMLYSVFNSRSTEESTSDRRYSYSQKPDIIHELVNEYNALIVYDTAKINSYEFQSTLLNKNVILDSTIIGFEEKKTGHSIKVRISSAYEGRIYAILKCSEELFEEIRQFSFKDAAIVANINRIMTNESENYVFQYGNGILLAKGKDILIAGECLEAVELAAF